MSCAAGQRPRVWCCWKTVIMRCRSDREKRLRYLEMEVWIMSKAAGGAVLYMLHCHFIEYDIF